MRKICIHFANRVIAAIQRPGKASNISLSKTVLLSTMENKKTGLFLAKFLGQLSCSIGGIIIHDKNMSFFNSKKLRLGVHSLKYSFDKTL